MTQNKKWTLKDSFCNSLRWSLVRNLSTSKAVQSSLIWLFIVPISARSLTKINTTATTYLKAYANTPDVTDENLNYIALEAFDNTKIINSNGIYNNAFYFVQNISDQHNKIAIGSSLIFHSLGLCALSTIAIQNIVFVLQSILS